MKRKAFLPIASLTFILALVSCGGNEVASSSIIPSSPSETSFPSSSQETSSSEESSSEVTSSMESSSDVTSSVSSDVSSSSSSSEDIPYYASINWNLTGAELKNALCTLIYPHKEIGYDAIRYVYEETDADEEGYLVDIYGVEKHFKATWMGGNYSQEGDTWNREHIVTQDAFGSGLPRSDIYNVYPTDGYVNGRRGNYPHGQVGEASYTSNNGSKLGNSSFPGYESTVFEPIDKWKGDIARSYFYSVTCYQELVPSWKNNGQFANNSYPSLSSWTVELFLSWHDQDPVDEWEKQRNEKCFAIQENRNPFIDHPEAAHAIWDDAY